MNEFKTSYNNNSEYILAKLDANMNLGNTFRNTLVTSVNELSGHQVTSIEIIVEFLNKFSTKFAMVSSRECGLIKGDVNMVRGKLNEELQIWKQNMFQKCGQSADAISQQKLVDDERCGQLKRFYN